MSSDIEPDAELPPTGQSLPNRLFQAEGPLAPWSPSAMKAMLLRGRRAAAAAAVRKLLQLLKELVSQGWLPHNDSYAKGPRMKALASSGRIVCGWPPIWCYHTFRGSSGAACKLIDSTH